jgi:hypothetical protein
VCLLEGLLADYKKEKTMTKMKERKIKMLKAQVRDGIIPIH